MTLGYILAETRGEADRLLAELAARLQGEGRVVAGVVQSRAPSPGAHPCDMELAVLPEGPEIGISQRLGGGARGCRLDPASLEDAAVAVSARLSAGAEVLILNKFGAHEGSGRGFCPVLALALEQGIPALTAVNPRNLESFLAFTGGLETRLEADAHALHAWVEAALAR
ncbi:DUF2478 domain-containing protein [Vannielia litorea]|uniref:Nucleoside-triphosphatase THEP1 n=1 Tax=Vannielia litorea TaxID=1217970 RepID=A0A1N6IDS5_9RHOB|nr:DUF2478 domain-containing protein [Vannielia litorea]SIO30168.1 Protein of unknown function [Vannielia litorea]